jgi:hypothetical protein
MFRRQSSFEQRHAVGRVLILQPEGRGERTDAEVERLQPAILRPKLEYVAGILAVRSAEIEQHIIFEVAEQLAVNADTGAARRSTVPLLKSRARSVSSGPPPRAKAKLRSKVERLRVLPDLVVWGFCTRRRHDLLAALVPRGTEGGGTPLHRNIQRAAGDRQRRGTHRQTLSHPRGLAAALCRQPANRASRRVRQRCLPGPRARLSGGLERFPRQRASRLPAVRRSSPGGRRTAAISAKSY